MTLSPTAIALLGLIAWGLLLALLILNQRGLLVLSGKMAVNAFAPDGSNLPGFGQRLARAHANCLENLPLQVGVLLYALQAGQTALTDPLALTLLSARLFQTVMHLLSTAPLFVWLRFAGFLVQVAILIWWLLRLSGLA
ncbi:MAPEG family protein [Pseudomonas sp. LS44]|uniref:MAPEG family protein n=1 Tax=Pseudomonas sp. LS44 TaxID=1357074 RepID=UPI00215B5856|nr:MAPEG family protein [Pseudomonas sp. LS44]UVE18408.1 MAPEG family protein [Pseudomonas sp. LS44]